MLCFFLTPKIFLPFRWRMVWSLLETQRWPSPASFSLTCSMHWAVALRWAMTSDRFNSVYTCPLPPPPQTHQPPNTTKVPVCVYEQVSIDWAILICIPPLHTHTHTSADQINTSNRSLFESCVPLRHWWVPLRSAAGHLLPAAPGRVPDRGPRGVGPSLPRRHKQLGTRLGRS